MTDQEHSVDVEYIRIFFPPDREEIAVHLGRIFTYRMGDDVSLIRPDDKLEDLIGWNRGPVWELVRLIEGLEQEMKLPKEAFLELDTFRDLIDYLADKRSAH